MSSLAATSPAKTPRHQRRAVVALLLVTVLWGLTFVWMKQGLEASERVLGPSGGGKSTLLRAIAGLVEIDHGRVSLHGRDVTAVAARDRGVGFVFQHYALFRHMSVADNIEFALGAGAKN